MKEYRLASWPELAPPFRHGPHRRILSDISHRHATVAQLTNSSGLRRQEVARFIESLEAEGHVTSRAAIVEPPWVRCTRWCSDRVRRAIVAVQGGV